MRELYDTQTLATALQDARNYTLRVYEHLDEQTLRFPYLRSVNPPLWERAHVAWFQEHWCLRWREGALREESLLANADAMLNSALIAHPDRWHLPDLSSQIVRAYMRRVLEATLDRLQRAPAPDLYFPLLALFHEDMHTEACLMALQTLGLPEPMKPNAIELPAASPIALREVTFAGGAFEIGTRPGREFAFDNEMQAHRVILAPFALATTTVTEGEYRSFVEAGGYGDQRWWSEAGWSWREASALSHPRHWQRDGTGWLVRRFDRLEPIDVAVAMMHLSAYEAQAYAAFVGARLPTEAEWEFAARAGFDTADDRYPWDETSLARGSINLDNRYGCPVASCALPDTDSRSGLRQLLGNVWEWTSSEFLPYPGFIPGPYREYSQPWFGNHRVLRGGSFATRARLVHNRWRNFYTPDRTDVFAGIRLARSLLE